MGSKFADTYIYIQASPLETVCILSIFTVKYFFLTKEEWNKVAESELKEIYLVYISF